MCHFGPLSTLLTYLDVEQVAVLEGLVGVADHHDEHVEHQEVEQQHERDEVSVPVPSGERRAESGERRERTVWRIRIVGSVAQPPLRTNGRNEGTNERRNEGTTVTAAPPPARTRAARMRRPRATTRRRRGRDARRAAARAPAIGIYAVVRRAVRSTLGVLVVCLKEARRPLLARLFTQPASLCASFRTPTALATL